MAADPSDIVTASYRPRELLSLRGTLAAVDTLLADGKMTQTFDFGITTGQHETIKDMSARVAGAVEGVDPTDDEPVQLKMTLRQAQAIRDAAAAVENLRVSNAGRGMLEEIGLNPRALDESTLSDIITATPAPPEQMISDLRRGGDFARGEAGRDIPGGGAEVMDDDGAEVFTDTPPRDDDDGLAPFIRHPEGFIIYPENRNPFLDADRVPDFSNQQIVREVRRLKNTAEELPEAVDLSPSEEEIRNRVAASADKVARGNDDCDVVLEALSDLVRDVIGVWGESQPVVSSALEAGKVMEGALDGMKAAGCITPYDREMIEEPMRVFLQSLKAREATTAENSETWVFRGQDALRGIARVKAARMKREQDFGPDTSPEVDENPVDFPDAAERIDRMIPDSTDWPSEVEPNAIYENIQTFSTTPFEDESVDVLMVDTASLMKMVGELALHDPQPGRIRLVNEAEPVLLAYISELINRGVLGDEGDDLYREAQILLGQVEDGEATRGPVVRGMRMLRRQAGGGQ